MCCKVSPFELDGAGQMVLQMPLKEKCALAPLAFVQPLTTQERPSPPVAPLQMPS